MAPTLQSLEAKLDMLLKKMDDFSALQAKVVRLETIVNDLSENVTSLNKEVLSLKEQANVREQQARGNSIRIFGLAVSEEEAEDTSGKVLSKRVYDLLIKPVLAAAKANKEIDVLPQQFNAISDVYRVRVGKVKAKATIPGLPQDPPAPAPIIVKFSSPHIRLAFLRNKRASLPAVSETDKFFGVKYYSATEDLTGPTYKKMREMMDSSLVEKVWAYDGRLRFTVPGDKLVKRVKSFFSSVEDIIRSG